MAETPGDPAERRRDGVWPLGVVDSRHEFLNRTSSTTATTWRCSGSTSKDESVDLVYPPVTRPVFNSNATYNVLFAEQGTRSGGADQGV